MHSARSNKITIYHVLQLSGTHVHFLKIKDSFKAIWLEIIWLKWKVKIIRFLIKKKLSMHIMSLIISNCRFGGGLK
jgi:hypothetical protein